MSHKLGICIPYRDRKNHLDELVDKLGKLLTGKGINHQFYVGHQVDDKLFNRGAMKNIAAQYAFNDGCDYIAWHDVDMIPDENVDYSYPENNPIHIATQLSKYDYSINYDQYFGGVILFTKEQVERTNGYSNEYWDWGQEDDDLFWRCYYEGYTTGEVVNQYENKDYVEFNGIDSHIELPTNREVSSCLHNDHTISILFNAEQQQGKVPIWLVGDTERKFIEYPLLRKDRSWTWGLSFNNSRALSSMVIDRSNNYHYTWSKRFENLWTWFTVSYKKDTNEYSVYVNDDLILNYMGGKYNTPRILPEKLRLHDSIKPFLLGFCNHTNTRFKGKISELKIYDTPISEIRENPILHFSSSEQFEGAVYNNVIFGKENIKVMKDVLPFRRDGKFECLPHIDEGFVNGKWAKGDTTARNERRFVTEMQQGKINYKTEGINQILDLMDTVNIDDVTYPNTKIINVKIK
jgi:hypothetical protein